MDTILIVGLAIAVVIFIIFIALIVRSSSANNLEKTLTKYGNIVAKVQNNIINNNEEILRESANKSADIRKDAVKTYAHALKEGFSEDDTIFCKHCGAQIDSDSRFCKKCGKEL